MNEGGLGEGEAVSARQIITNWYGFQVRRATSDATEPASIEKKPLGDKMPGAHTVRR